MTTPSIAPTRYSKTSQDFNIAKVDREGALRTEYVNVNVPSGTVVNTVVGLVPFRRGARFVCHASGLNVGALGTSVTASVGYVYDDNVTFTNAPAAFVSASTTAAAGGTISLTGLATSYSFVAAADGWIAVTLAGATTGSSGDINAQITLSYDGLV